jgi:aspartate 4-decarboxylase
MLVHNKRIVHEYLMWAMCGKPRPPGSFDLYAVECGTEAIRCFFKSLKAHRLLLPGDTITLGTRRRLRQYRTRRLHDRTRLSGCV